MIGRLISGPTLPTSSPHTIFAAMNASSSESAAFR
jgi:hypothetical protein